ncbi:MAG: prolipoprotein diacylglyceryl transferase family protein [Smithella sp.]|jgi:prolipoprotein diacylglyceryltransferase
MLDEIFIAILFLALMLIFRWAFQALPDEHWQIIGCLPYLKLTDGRWQGWNLTWYGFFNAVAIVFAVCMFLILIGSLSTPLIAGLSLLTLLLAICLPAAKIMAFLIEKKQNTFTVGGASFIGIVAAPWTILLTNITVGKLLGFNITPINVLAAMSIAYTLGEGIGRLACISFGCCYGKPLADCSPLINKIFQRYNFIFSGKTKKIAYAHELDGQQVIPVQALTAVIYSLTGLAGCYLFLKGFTTAAFVLTLIVTQLWRTLSEFMRADYRGEGIISVYQIMASVACLYGLLIAYIFNRTPAGTPDLALGLRTIWNPAVLIFLLVLWVSTLFYMGKSRVTTSLIEIHVLRENI